MENYKGETMIKKIIIKFAVLAFLMSNASFADIKFWTTEVQPARMAKQQEMAKAFEAQSGIKVEVIPVEEKALGTRIGAYRTQAGEPTIGGLGGGNQPTDFGATSQDAGGFGAAAGDILNTGIVGTSGLGVLKRTTTSVLKAEINVPSSKFSISPPIGIP